MKKMVNTTFISGLIYESRLEKKVSGPNSKNPGTEFINGFLDIATDDDCLNIVPVHFTYVTPTTSSGKNSPTFTTLNSIINGTYKTIIKDGKENATKVSVNSAFGLNEFFSNRSGQEELVSVLRNEGGFINVLDALDPDEKKRNQFRCDIIINNVRHVDADPENDRPEKAIVHGVIFDFRGSILPVDLTVTNPNAIAYFEDQDISDSNPFFTQVWGRQISETIRKSTTIASAFGDAFVNTTPSSRKEFLITGAIEDPYVWDDEETITVKELSAAMAKRETDIAEIKRRQDEYQASKTAAAAPANNTSGGFNF